MTQIHTHRYKQKLISRISVDYNFVFMRYAWLWVLYVSIDYSVVSCTIIKVRNGVISIWNDFSLFHWGSGWCGGKLQIVAKNLILKIKKLIMSTLTGLRKVYSNALSRPNQPKFQVSTCNVKQIPSPSFDFQHWSKADHWKVFTTNKTIISDPLSNIKGRTKMYWSFGLKLTLCFHH